MRTRFLQAVSAAAAVLALLTFVHALSPERAEITVASGTLRSLDDSDDAAQQALDQAEQQSELNSQQQASQYIYQAEQSDPLLIQDQQQSPVN